MKDDGYHLSATRDTRHHLHIILEAFRVVLPETLLYRGSENGDSGNTATIGSGVRKDGSEKAAEAAAVAR